MKIYCYILFICLFFNKNLSCQNTFVSISGVVTDSDNNEPVLNAYVHLKVSSGLMLECKTDSTGHYEFKIKDDTTSSFLVTIGSDKFTSSKSNKYGFLANKYFGKGRLNGNISFIKDFMLTPLRDCFPTMPVILFYKNSIVSCNDSLFKMIPFTILNLTMLAVFCIQP